MLFVCFAISFRLLAYDNKKLTFLVIKINQFLNSPKKDSLNEHILELFLLKFI